MIQSKNIPNSDVAVIGAGIVGLTFAMLIAETGLNIVVISRDVPNLQIDNGDYSARVSAISKSSENLLVETGVWQRILRKQQYTRMSVWEKDSFGRIAFDASEFSRPNLGHIIENNVLEYALREAITETHNVQIMDEKSLSDIQQDNGVNLLTFDDKSRLQVSLLVGADGAFSKVNQLLNLHQFFSDYDHEAIVANIHCGEKHEETAMQAFTPDGPLAFLPLPDSHQVSIVWSQSTNKARRLMALDDDLFCKKLYAEIDGSLGAIELTCQRQSFPLTMRYTQSWCKGSAAIMGDAAHTIHPLAGQGANLGIADAHALSSLIKQSLSDNRTMNNIKMLRHYERWRKAEALKTIAVMGAFKSGFAGTDPIKKLIRGTALSAANRLHLLKSIFIDQAAGY